MLSSIALVTAFVSAAAPTKADYTKLEYALTNSFITTQHSKTGSAGAQGCLFDARVAAFSENNGLNATAQALQAFVNKNFPNTSFTSGDIVSLAGKAAVEKVYPCIKIKWGYGRHSCTLNETESGPKPTISSLAEMQPFLTRYGLTATEMATLTVGAHGVAGAVNTQSESGIFSFDFANVTGGVDFIKKTTSITYKYFTTWYGDATAPLTGTAIGRFPSDMLFFPTTMKNISGTPVDNSTTIAAVEKTLLAYNDASFNKAFGAV